MKLLLDTHALIWALSAPQRLPKTLRLRLERAADGDVVFASAASAWEIAIKSELGKIEFPIAELGDAIAEAGFVELPISLAHAAAVRGLAKHHRDPFDRLLVAQASKEGLVIASRDPAIRLYQIPIIWN